MVATAIDQDGTDQWCCSSDIQHRSAAKQRLDELSIGRLDYSPTLKKKTKKKTWGAKNAGGRTASVLIGWKIASRSCEIIGEQWNFFGLFVCLLFHCILSYICKWYNMPLIFSVSPSDAGQVDGSGVHSLQEVHSSERRVELR